MRLRQAGWLAATGLTGLGVALVTLAVPWQGCAIYNSSLLLPEAGPDGEAGGQEDDALDASPDGASEAGATCLATPPSRPAQSDVGGTGDYTGIVAMQTIDVGANTQVDASLPPIGFDLDNDCTCCAPAGNGCHIGGSCIAQSPVCDDDAGRDHEALKLFQYLGPGVTTNADDGLQAGQFSILLQISNYNGLTNDTNVTVALYGSNGVVGIQDGGSVTARHDGTDRWTVDPAYVATNATGGSVADGTDCSTGGCLPQYSDSAAYVSGGVLVAHLTTGTQTLPLTFGYRANIGGALMKLTGVVAVGTLKRVTLDGGATAWGIVNGSISGRWSSTQLLGNLATIPNGSVDGSFYCGSDDGGGAMFYCVVKDYVCSIQDIMSNQDLDNQKPQLADCDSLSMSLGFTAEPAQLGTVYTVPPPPSGCGGTWTDTCGSSVCQ